MTAVEPALPNTHFTATVAGNAIEVIADGPMRLAKLLAMIDAARTSVRMMFYIFVDDTSGQAVRDALLAAAKRGVAVNVLLDSFGSSTLSDSYFAPLRAMGAKVRWFGTSWTPHYLIRNHQKLLIIDGAQALTGGFNIEVVYFAAADDPGSWQDLAVVLNGPIVDQAVQWFDALSRWMDTPRPSFSQLRRLVRKGIAGTGAVRWLAGGPTPRLNPWASELRRTVTAGRDLAMSMAYFSPNTGTMRRIARVVRRGGTATLILPSRSDNAATVGAARLAYGYLLKRGVRIWEFERSLLHNKLCVIDDVVMIGSANVDMRSLFINMELMLRVEDAAFAAQCRALIERQKCDASEVTLSGHRLRANWWTRLRWTLAWTVVGVIDYSVTRRLNFGLGEDPSVEDDRRDPPQP